MFSQIKIDPADQAFSLYIRAIAGWRCERCLKYFPEEERRGLSCSHFIGRSNQATRFYPDNCAALCTGCHGYFETHKATAYRDFMIKRLGMVRFKHLVALSRMSKIITKEDKKEIAADFKLLLKKLL